MLLFRMIQRYGLFKLNPNKHATIFFKQGQHGNNGFLNGSGYFNGKL